MTNHFPDVGSAALHISELTYYSQVYGSISGLPPNIIPPTGNFQSSYLFDTGRIQLVPQTDLEQVTWGYDWFDEDEADLGFLQLVDWFVQGISTAIGLSMDEVRSAIIVQRIWTVEQNVVGTSAPYNWASQGPLPQIVEMVPYPAAQDSDSSRGRDGGENVAQQ